MIFIATVFLAIDDTDNADSVGTGHVLEDFREVLRQKGVETQAISRHQLYFHEDVPYTSHNSAMCTEMDVPKAFVPELIHLATEHLLASFAEGSDPGLCAAVMNDVADIARVIMYGRRAKSGLLTKDEAYQLAKEQNIRLSEHGGTGQGVVGALAGVGLRMFGFDGRLKGKIIAGEDGETMTASELLERTGFCHVMAVNGAAVQGNDVIRLTEGRVKAVRMNWRSTVIVMEAENGASYATLPKELLKAY